MTSRIANRPAAYRLLGVAVVLAALVGGGAGLWYVFLRPGGPAAVDASLVAVPSAPTSSTGASASADPSSGAIAGKWSVDTSIGSFADFSSSFVGYRVQEVLGGIGGQTAVGRTPNVSGSLQIEGPNVTAVQVTADLSTLQSDDDRRDGQLRQQALETGRFPTATFALAEPIALPAAAASGDTIDVVANGELTLHGVTQAVQVPITARLDSGVIVLTGSIDIVFADYDMQPPSSFVVLSVDGHGVMELQLFLTRT